MDETSAGKPTTLLGWRLLALVYDFFPALALWMLAAAAFTFGFYEVGHSARENIAPFSAPQLVLWLLCWLLTGAYAVLSWHRGGQTLGMRPWRLRVVGVGGANASWPALLKRYAVGTLSLLLLGAGFWWAWVDRDRLAWHDRFSGTRMWRSPRSAPQSP